MKVIIMAGGKGTRISSVRNDVPKPMIPVAGKPILEWQIANLKACGLTDIVIVVGHLGNIIMEYFGDGSHYGVKINYFIEEKPLGTAGALFRMPELRDDFLLMCGDVVLDVDFNRFIEFHKGTKALASLMAHPNGHPYDSSLLVTEVLPPQELGGNPVDTHKVIKWLSKGDERLYYSNRVNAGIEIVSPKLLQETRKKVMFYNDNYPNMVDLDRDILKANISTGKIYAYDTPEYIKDMGTPERYYEVENDILTGKLRSRNLKNRQKAVFLDRDGTINKYVGFLTRPEQFELLDGVTEAIRLINKSGLLAIVVTNQPVIARGDCTWEQLQLINMKMETELGKDGCFLDAIYICPHHPNRGFKGERLQYKIECQCRKPKTGLLLQASLDFNIDLSQSYMVGDSDVDVIAGRSCGVKLAVRIKEGGLLQTVKRLLEDKN